MTPMERLQKCQERLDARGGRLSHVTWGNIEGKTRDQLATDLAEALEAFLDGRCTPAKMYDRPEDRMCKHDDGDCHADDPCSDCPVYTTPNPETKP